MHACPLTHYHMYIYQTPAVYQHALNLQIEHLVCHVRPVSHTFSSLVATPPPLSFPHASAMMTVTDTYNSMYVQFCILLRI